MQNTSPGLQLALSSTKGRWGLRDFAAAAGLFAATAAVVLGQNAHLAVLYDLSYVLNISTRIAMGQAPYRDFPFVHAPLTFLVQAAIIRLVGRVYFHHVLYAAAVGGLGTVLAWRIALRTLRGRMAGAWAVSVMLAAPLSVLGIYCILPTPFYDCDCVFSILVAVWLLQRVALDGAPGIFGRTNTSRFGEMLLPFLAGVAVVVPVFYKQNIGLPLLGVAIAALVVLLGVRLVRREKAPDAGPGVDALLAVLGGAGAALAAGVLLLQCTVGLGNYLHWTIQFAAQRRMPGLADMVGVYREPWLVWMLPCVVVALLPMLSRLGKARWARIAGLALMAAPFVWTLLTLLLYDDADERGDSLLALWPLLLILSAVLMVFNLYRSLSLKAVAPVLVLVTINGTLMSQQLWGSTYAIWPLLVLLIAEMIAFLADVRARAADKITAPLLAGTIAVALLVCGGFYTASEERLAYLQLPEGPVVHATFPELKGMNAPGPYVPEFEELLRYAAAKIPLSDGVMVIPGEEPFYFATGRAALFPVQLFDRTTDPYSPEETAEVARTHNISWVVVKTDLQMKEDVTPDRDALLKALLSDFTQASRLHGYDVYRRR
jgi:hypothetical protein